MKAKKVKWTQKPMTWGGYFKFAGISALVSLVLCIPSMIYTIKAFSRWADN